MNIACFKNIVGEDIISEVELDQDPDNHDLVRLKNPLLILIVPQERNDQYTVALIPYMQYSSQREFVFKQDHMILTYEPSVELANEYRRITGVGIVIAKPDLSIIK